MNLEEKLETKENGKFADIIRGVVAEMFAKKERILIATLFENGIDCDPKTEALRRFPRLLTEVHGNESRHYWNDGSEEGIHIVTFIDKDPEEDEEGKIKFTFDVVN